MCKKGIYPFLLHLLLIFIQPYSPHHYRLVDIHQIIENCSGMIINSSKLSEIKMSHTYDCLDRQDRHSRWPRSKSRLVRLGKACTVRATCFLRVALVIKWSSTSIILIIEIFQSNDHHMSALHAEAVVVNLVQYDVIFLWSIIFLSSNIW